MENQNFACPHCGKKQPLKKLLLLSNFSKWNCPHCGTEVAPEKKSPVHGAVYGVLGGAFYRYSCKLLFIHAKLQLS